MGLELIAAIVAAVGFAGLALMAQKLTGGRLPKWITPFAAGVGLIGFTVWSEYDWFDRVSGKLPEGVKVVWTDTTPQALRPWTFIAPLTTRFIAMDERGLAPHPDNAALVLAPVYAFARWRGVDEGFLVVDCAAQQSVKLTATVTIREDGTLTGGEWQPLDPDGDIGPTACTKG